MNYDQLFSFVVFAEELSFAAAARLLHISQPSLHVQIRKLGASVGVPLYVRDGRRLRLTGAGRQLASYGRTVRDAGARVIAELRGAERRGHVTLAAGRGSFLYLLGGALRRFPKKRWPLHLLPASAAQAKAAVVEATADLAVTTRPEESTTLVIETLRQVRQKLVVPSSHRLAGRQRIRVSDLSGEPLIVAAPGRPHRAAVERAMSEVDAELEVVVEADGWELMLHFVRLGLGVALVNDYCRTPRGCVEVAVTGMPEIELCLVRGQGFDHPGADTLAELIRQSCRD